MSGLATCAKRADISTNTSCHCWPGRISRPSVIAEAARNPKRSALLDKLLAGNPVIVAWTTARPYLPADPPHWLSDPRITPHIRVYRDDLVEPADGPPRSVPVVNFRG
jgi:hypothetical protein